MKPLKFKEFVSEKKENKDKKEVAKVVEPEEIKKKGKPVKAEVVEQPEPEKKKGLTPRQQKYLPEPLKAAILKAQGESFHVQKFNDFVNENKKTMTKKELKDRVKEEAKRMFSDIKKQGGGMSLSDCKREAEKTFRDEYNIVESVETQFNQSTIDAICDEAKYGNRVLINEKTAWSGLGDRTSLYSFANELTREKWEKSGEKFKKKLQSLNKFQDVIEVQSYMNTGRFKGKWETVRRFKAK